MQPFYTISVFVSVVPRESTYHRSCNVCFFTISGINQVHDVTKWGWGIIEVRINKHRTILFNNYGITLFIYNTIALLFLFRGRWIILHLPRLDAWANHLPKTLACRIRSTSAKDILEDILKAPLTVYKQL